MFSRLATLGRRMAKRLRSEDGSSTIEFIILFPVVMFMFLSTFELGIVMLRQVMLDRATDVAVRELRLGTWTPPSHDAMKDYVCDLAALLPDCKSNIRIELQPVSTQTWTPLDPEPSCVDKDADIEAEEEEEIFADGTTNDMMLVRICALMTPFFPSTGLGAQMKYMYGEYYALVSASAFVIEPQVTGSSSSSSSGSGT